MNPRLSFDRQCFYLDGNPIYFASGEIHYFRVEKSAWKHRFQLLKESNCNCVATYIPWRLHEENEGVFTFDSGNGVTDISDFLELAKKENISVILRPGPYSYSELVADGLPDWLIEKYPELLARKKDDTPIHPAAVSYLHSVFQEKVRIWFREVARVIRPFLDVNGGPVILIQLDNEAAGIHVWRDSLDYNCETIGLGDPNGRLCRFLQTRYRSIGELNTAYGTSFSAWQEYDPRRSGKDPLCSCRMQDDYGDFYCLMLKEYLEFLAALAVENGINTSFCHNSGNIGITAFFKESIENNALLLGCDHYWNLNPQWPQNNPTPQKLIENLFSCRMLESFGFPAWVPEFQYGNISQWPSIAPEDLNCSLFAHLAFGMKGHNGYIFAGGNNPGNSGWTCKTYDYSAPVSADGKLRQTYEVVQSFCQFSNDHPELLNSHSDSDIDLVIDWSAWRPGYQQDAVPQYICGRSKMRHHHLDTVFPTLINAGIMPNILPENSDFDKDKVLCAVCGGTMSQHMQRKIADFVLSGGSLILWGAVPGYDERCRPCTLLADMLQLPVSVIVPTSYGGVDFSGSEDAVFTGELFAPEKTPADCTVLAKDSRRGYIAAYSKTYGTGRAVINGCLFKFWRFSHAEYLAKLFSHAGGTVKIENSNPWVLAIRRRDSNGKIWMFFINASSSKQTLSCSVRGGNGILDYGKITLEPMQVKIFREKELLY